MHTSTGVVFLDTFLGGGYDHDIITTIYGPSGSGKTNLCLIAAVHCASAGKKVIFLDTEGGIAVERIRQICPEYEKVLERMLFFNPVTFLEQKKIFTNSNKHLLPYFNKSPPTILTWSRWSKSAYTCVVSKTGIFLRRAISTK